MRLQLVSAALLSLSFLLSSGCGLEQDALSDDGLRHVVLDADTVAAQLADPDASIFIDLSEASYTFDQSEGSFDYSRFLVRCPSMVAPMPMEAVADMLGFELERVEWSMASVDAQGFRYSGGVCEELCDESGEDCMWIC